MSKYKLVLLFIIAVLVIIIFLISSGPKNDPKGIEKAVFSLNQPMTKIAHIEVLGNKEAIAFYEWGNGAEVYFGHARLKKDVFGWHFKGGSTSQTPKDYKIGWSFSNLKEDFSHYTDLLNGKILDSGINEVLVITDKGKQYPAYIIEYNNGERFWYLMTKGEELIGSTVKGRSKNGEIMEQIPR